MRRAQKTIMIYDCRWRGGSVRMNRTLSYIKGITFAFQKPSTKRSEYLLLCTLKFMKKCINCTLQSLSGLWNCGIENQQHRQNCTSCWKWTKSWNCACYPNNGTLAQPIEKCWRLVWLQLANNETNKFVAIIFFRVYYCRIEMYSWPAAKMIGN